MSWNHLEGVGNNCSELELDGALALESLPLELDHTENLRGTYSNINTYSFYGYGVLSEQHELEINGPLRISIQ